MLSVKIEFCRFDCGIQAIKQQLLCTTKFICVKCFQAIGKSSKKENAIYST